MPEKAKSKTNLQQRVSLRITLPKSIILQSDTNALIFAATQNDKAKMARKTEKKTCNSEFYYILPCYKRRLYKPTLKH